MISNVHGEFSKLSGTVVLDPADVTRSSVDVSMQTSSINTREPQRDEHLRSADFFDVSNHPTMTFRSRRIAPAGADHFKVTGDLTIRGTTKEVSFDVEGPTPPVKDPWGNVRVRRYGDQPKSTEKRLWVVFNALMEGGGVMVGDEVSLSIEAELVQKTAA